MITRLPGAIVRAFLVVLLIASPALLLPGMTPDGKQIVALVAIFGAALTIFDGAVKSCWPMACLYRSLRFGEEYLPVSALLVDKT